MFAASLPAHSGNALLALIRGAYTANPGKFWRSCLFWCFWFSLAFFPAGYGFREVMPPVCAIFLILYYKNAWRESTLARLGKPVLFFLCAFFMTCIGVIFSSDPWQSFLHAGMGVNKAYILPFIAMECAQNLRDLRRLCWACVLACFWEGLDGVWQAFTGADFIMGYTFAHRLTGSLGDYTVGNYLALALPPAFGVLSILRQKLPVSCCILIFIALFWPAFFLFIGASSRSAVLALAGILCIWAIMRKGFRHWLWLLLPASAISLFLLFEGYRFLPENIIYDNRWDLWGLAWQIFKAHPWFGAGAGLYSHAFQALGLAPAREAITISHPHCLYLDMLYAHGIIGFCLGMTFIFGFLSWGLKKVGPFLRHANGFSDGVLYGRLTAWFWLGYAAWLLNGIFGHDFYRIWWLALAMCNMGIMVGAIVNAPSIDVHIEM